MLAILFALLTAVDIFATVSYQGPGFLSGSSYRSIDDTIVYYRRLNYREGTENYLYNIEAIIRYYDSAVVKAAIYRDSDSTVLAVFYPVKLVSSSSGTAVIDTVDFRPIYGAYWPTSDSFYIAFWGQKLGSAAGSPGIRHNTGDIGLSIAWDTTTYVSGNSGWSSPLVMRSSQSDRRLAFRLGMTDNQISYGTSYNWRTRSVNDDSMYVVCSLSFEGMSWDEHDSTKLFVATVTEPQIANWAIDSVDFSAVIIDGDLIMGESEVCSVLVGLSSGQDIVVQAIDYADSVGGGTNFDTSDIAALRMYYTTDTFNITIQQGRSQGKTRDATLSKLANLYTYFDTRDLRIMSGSNNTDEKVVVCFDSALYAIPSGTTILQAKLHMVSQSDTANHWQDSMRVCVSLVKDTFSEVFSYSSGGVPSWARKATATSWSDSGIGSRSQYGQGSYCYWVNTATNNEYEFDVTHLVAFAYNIRKPISFVIAPDDANNKNYKYRRAFWSSEYNIDRGNRVWLEIIGTTITLDKLPSYARGPLGVDKAHDSTGVSTAHGGVRE